MKKISLGFCCLWSGCPVCWLPEKHHQRNQAMEPVAQTYTIEQFMNTTSIGGSDFSPDNSKVLYSSNETGVYNAFEVTVAGGEPHQLNGQFSVCDILLPEKQIKGYRAILSFLNTYLKGNTKAAGGSASSFK